MTYPLPRREHWVFPIGNDAYVDIGWHGARPDHTTFGFLMEYLRLTQTTLPPADYADDRVPAAEESST